MSSTTALRFYETGRPDEVIRLETLDLLPPGADEVRVRVLAASINPADLNQLEGTYGIKPVLPAIPGNEGVGVVEQDAGEFKKGDFVLLRNQAWREEGNWKAVDLIPIGEVNDPLQFAMLRINPPTALRMLSDFVPLTSSDWVVQNVANSGVGRWVSAICARKDWPLVSLVRKPFETPITKREQRMIEGVDSLKLIRDYLGNAGAKLALNAVGGESASLLMKCLGQGGTLVTYGAMSRKPLLVSNGHLIFKDIQVRGFWVSRWLKTAPVEATRAMYAELAEMVRLEEVAIPIASTFPLSQASQALKDAMQSGRSGKILFDMRR